MGTTNENTTPDAGAELDVEELRTRLDERDREVKELRAELAGIYRRRQRTTHVLLASGRLTSRLAVRIAAWVTLGPGLTNAMQRWFKAKTAANPFPVEETADVAAAVVRRRLSASRFVWRVLLSLGGLITTGLLVWHGLLIQAQIQRQDDQNELFRAQIEEQRKDNLIVRRAQLLDTIYTEECEDPEDQNPSGAADLAAEEKTAGAYLAGSTDEAPPAETACIPKANPQAVQEAVLAFVEIERGRGERADLRGSNLRGADLSGADLREARFGGADLREVDLSEANLSEANLHWANLSGADLSEANLSGADLRLALLGEADLSEALLHEARLGGADLRGVEAGALRDRVLGRVYVGAARNLTPEQLAATCGNEDTKLPAGFEMPEAWPCRWAKYSVPWTRRVR